MLSGKWENFSEYICVKLRKSIVFVCKFHGEGRKLAIVANADLRREFVIFEVAREKRRLSFGISTS